MENLSDCLGSESNWNTRGKHESLDSSVVYLFFFFFLSLMLIMFDGVYRRGANESCEGGIACIESTVDDCLP